MALDAQLSQAHTCLGVTFVMRDRVDEALDHYRKAIEVDPANPDPYYNIACVFAVKNKKQESMEYLKLAVLNGYIQFATLGTDPELKNLHGDPTFEKLKLGQFD